MPRQDRPVALLQLPNEFIAEVVVGILRDEGIAAFTSGENLQDEFAASQRLLGTLGCTVFVSASAVDRAREVLSKARSAGRLGEDVEWQDGAGGNDDAEDA